MRLTVLLAFLMAMGCVSSGGWDTERVDDDDATGDDDDATGDDDDATGDDDDATADDDDATGDDDDATADDDDATADDDDATGDDDDATGDDDDSTSAPACGPLGTMLPAAICEAVIWGVDLSFGCGGVTVQPREKPDHLDHLGSGLSITFGWGIDRRITV